VQDRRTYPELGAGGFTRNDGTVAFYQRVHALLPDAGVVVDLSAGRGQAFHDDAVPYRRRLRDLRAPGRTVLGLDVDPVVLTNPGVDEARVVVDGRLPLDDGSVDAVVADAVLEHVEDAVPFAAEVDRVLRPGGWLCARTPNRHGYIALGARLVPNPLHVAVLRRLQPDRQARDVFPTPYRMNTRRALEQLSPAARYEDCSYAMHPDPAYAGRSGTARALFRAANRVTPDRFGAMFLVFLQKRPQPTG